MIHTQKGGLGVWRFESLSQFEGLQHGVTGRPGGVSRPPYAALNLGLHVGDDPAAVIENRRRLCAALGLDIATLTLGAQVHGAELAIAGEQQVGAGSLDLASAIPGVDGLVITRPGLLAAVLSADCVPLVLYDPKRRVGAVIHAGWRGAAAGIAARAVRLLRDSCASDPEHLYVAIAPAIGVCCYQVSQCVAGRVVAALPDPRRALEQRDGAWYVDLAECSRQQLLASGVLASHIEGAGICTSCRADAFFSERRLGRPTGRLGTFLVLL